MLVTSVSILPLAARHPFDITPDVTIFFRAAVIASRPTDLLVFHSSPRRGLSLMHLILDHVED